MSEEIERKMIFCIKTHKFPFGFNFAMRVKAEKRIHEHIDSIKKQSTRAREILLLYACG